jgi:hypothetical protein
MDVAYPFQAFRAAQIGLPLRAKHFERASTLQLPHRGRMPVAVGSELPIIYVSPHFGVLASTI